ICPQSALGQRLLSDPDYVGLTRDTLIRMGQVTVRELRNHGGEVIDRVAKGERVTITRAGKPVAELRPLISSRTSGEALIARWQHLPRVNPVLFREDVDGLLDSSL